MHELRRRSLRAYQELPANGEVKATKPDKHNDSEPALLQRARQGVNNDKILLNIRQLAKRNQPKDNRTKLPPEKAAYKIQYELV